MITDSQIKEKLSDRLWRLNNLYYVKDRKGQKVLFRLNPHQMKLHEGLWFMLIIPKARQLGITTFFTILYLDQILFQPNKTACIIAHKKEDVQKIFRSKIKFAWNNLHPWLKSYLGEPITDSANELSFANGSSISVSMSTRSGTVQFLHCVHPDMEIFLPDGKLEKIKDLKSGDTILNGRGRKSKIKSIIVKKTEERMLSISSFGHYRPLMVTEKHQVLCREHKTGRPIWKRADELVNGDYLGMPITEFSFINKSTYDFSLGRLCGLYLAEGSIRKKELTLSLHQKEINTILNWVEEFKDDFASKRVYYTKNSKTAIIALNSFDLIPWIVERFGQGKNKFISNKVFSYSSNFLKGLIFGYLFRDRSILDKFSLSFCGIRRDILEQMRRILISLRYGVPALSFAPAGERYGRNCQDMWTLKLNGAGNWKFRKEFNLPLPEYITKSAKYRLAHDRCPTERKFWRRGADYYWMRVKKIEEIRRPEFVYDLVLDGSTHSFTTSTGVIHNCSEFGYICQKFPDKAEEIVTGSLNSVEQGQMISIESTAAGREGYFYDYCMQAQKNQKEGRKLTPLDWKLFFFPWWEEKSYSLKSNFNITQDSRDYFNMLKQKHGITLTDDQVRWYIKKKEMMGDKMFAEYPSTIEEAFSVQTEGAYFQKDMSRVYLERRIRPVPFDPMLPVETWWDLGMDDFNVLLLTQRQGKEIRFINMYWNRGEPLSHYYTWLEDEKSKYGYNYSRHNLPHDVEVKELNTGKSRHNTLLALGMRNIRVLGKYDIPTTIDQVRKIFPRFIFDEDKCTRLHEALFNYRKEFDAKLGAYKERPRKDENCHFVDPVRGMAMVWKDSEYGYEQDNNAKDSSLFA